MKEDILLNIKNIFGWKSGRKIVVISVDDYGNVRLNSKKDRDEMEKKGLKKLSHFDIYDSLENKQDLEMLFDVLTSVVDKNNRHAVFTPFALPCNINFGKVENSGFEDYYSETLDETYSKLSSTQGKAYKGAWELWKEGIDTNLMVPQFHGKEHLNLKVFREKLLKREFELITSLKHRSYARIPSSEFQTISTNAAFDFWEFNENETFDNLIEEGLNAFESVFGYRATHFNPPAGQENPFIHKTLKENGIKYLDTPLIKKEHKGKGKYKRVINYTGKKNKLGQTYIVRNVVFEPTHERRGDWVSYTMKQIEAAFRWNRPAIISSHRVNFSGHIDPENRKKGLDSLKELLKKIVKKWPDVEFMSANELGDLIAGETK